MIMCHGNELAWSCACAGSQPNQAVLLEAEARHCSEGIPAAQDHRCQGRPSLKTIVYRSADRRQQHKDRIMCR